MGLSPILIYMALTWHLESRGANAGPHDPRCNRHSDGLTTRSLFPLAVFASNLGQTSREGRLEKRLPHRRCLHGLPSARSFLVPSRLRAATVKFLETLHESFSW